MENQPSRDKAAIERGVAAQQAMRDQTAADPALSTEVVAEAGGIVTVESERGSVYRFDVTQGRWVET